MTQHHPDSHSLMEYSAGNLSDPHALCIRLHLDQCPHCRSRVDMLDSLGAVMMEQQTSVDVSEGMFDRILDTIDQQPEAAPTPKKPVGNPLERLLGSDINTLPWKRQLADVSVLDITHLFPSQPEQVVLQKLTAGGKAPAHTHRGSETTIVLQGAFSDHKGVFKQWDFVVLDQSDEHKPVALEGDDCITLSVLSAPVKLTGTFTRLLNPFIR
ncbi:anti-sigma-E factor ChrR [Marinobacter nanhaiticus D15-8W]|uniref:Anti-sigma factor n=1 Tax=Marinobacter nanhaiticus D15-8W TaxID=626887 RepID=N6WT45_9GAMM|nr:ChrR family anti-sigma-E factor [Marinobacter nanhaiticus]ENO14666.1 anti-sigma factor [Marinobacter nanhaiticus D15-8W]BES69647.1 anti-sigma-E factor ChrR [Marinobacter nanhaiticus D15-8W]